MEGQEAQIAAPTIDDAIDALRNLKPERQSALAEHILALAIDDRHPEGIDSADLSFVLEGLDQANRGEFATRDEVDAAFRKFRG